ncbi:hypothetical protein GSI_06438 [Ganoderma sinense ZZ0214-1]|uniref:Threonine/serine exporter-like N-terminal domain-containing protein n=1 Tax=Ganoderma sinense ZZ0214-1 TaxID=1077348 RepID=A0A2G8SD88_9APHY|nr:hypothetical protein GSI_06438 [Ganoderma sinense ZZ0214-1]
MAPRRGSIAFSPSVPVGKSRSGDDRDMSPRTRREYPTPHPRKLAAAAAHLQNGRDTDGADYRGSPSTPENLAHRPQPSFAGSSRTVVNEATAPGPRRTTLPRRMSTMYSDSDFFQFRTGAPRRTLSSAEEGGGSQGRPRRENGGHDGVVAELIQYGLRHDTVRPRSGSGSGGGGKAMLRRMSASSLYEQGERDEGEKVREMSYRDRSHSIREMRRTSIVDHVEDYVSRQKFILRLAKALLSFGAPSHRIESQLHSAGETLNVNVAFVHLPNLIIVTFMDEDTRTSETHFVRAGGRVALTKLQQIHIVYRDVLHDRIGTTEGCERLKRILQARPLYSIWFRCVLAFLCASIICVLAFGGSILDMFVSGASASLLQYLGLNAASKSAIYANVYEISVSIVVSFLARALGTLPDNLFCYSAVSSAGVVLILPGFTILIAALELTSRNILCGSVRMVYAIIYTLFLGFGLTIGSDFYLLVNPAARRHLSETMLLESETYHGYILSSNTSIPIANLGATFTFVETEDSGQSHIVQGCYRNPSWPWWRQPFPWWATLFLVPVYSICSSISNLQSIRSIQLPIMVLFSCLAYAANRTANYFIRDRADIVSASGAFVIGFCGNAYSRLVGGTAFTSMVTGVLFLVPSAIGSGGGLIQPYHSSIERYSGSFELGIRMIQVAIGVTIGLFVAQIVVYALGRRKSAAHFAF